MKRFSAVLLTACFLLLSCGKDTDAPAVTPTNMGSVIVSLDGLAEGEYGTISAGGVGSAVEADHYPIFVNGSILSGAPSENCTFYYDGVTDPAVDIGMLADAYCGFTELKITDSGITLRYRYGIYGAGEVIRDSDLTVVTLSEGSDLAEMDQNTVTLSAAVKITENEDGSKTVFLPYEDAAKVLDLNVSFYDSANTAAWEGHDQTDGAAYYLSGTPHLMFWKYPEDAKVFTEEEAVEIARGTLIAAYENNYGQFVPLSEEECDSIGGDQGFYNREIQNLEVTGENDRFWRIPFVYDFLVDKYTGDVLTQYNGMSEVFTRFDPYANGALMFPG